MHTKPTRALYQKRNNKIYDRYLKGESLASIGRSYKISREAVRQVVAKERYKRGDEPHI